MREKFKMNLPLALLKEYHKWFLMVSNHGLRADMSLSFDIKLKGKVQLKIEIN